MEKLSPPSGGGKWAGNDRFEGFVPDLATEIARAVGFDFELEPTDGYGSLDRDTGRWNGMIRELLEEVRGEFNRATNYIGKTGVKIRGLNEYGRSDFETFSIAVGDNNF